MSDEEKPQGGLREYLVTRKKASLSAWRAASEKSTDPNVRAAFTLFESNRTMLDHVNKLESAVEGDEE